MKKLRIDFLCGDGSPLGVSMGTLYGEDGRVGVGGSEQAMLTLCESWHRVGCSVRLYNSPTHPDASPFQQLPIDLFDPQEDRDVVIVFRSPNHRISGAKGLKLWFSCDQYTIGDFREFSTQVDKIVTISPFHANYFDTVYGIKNTHVIDLPVRTWDYDKLPFGQFEKVLNRLIFCSVPDRGLHILAECYPMIKAEIPDASLVITSDYRLWGVGEPRNEQYIQRFLGMDGVRFVGAIPRREMVKEQMKAQIQAYPNIYDELFCYSVAECQVAGALPITSSVGALATTNMGVIVEGNPADALWKRAWVDMIVQHLKDPDLAEKQRDVQLKALERFSIDRILKEWNGVMEND